MNRRTRTFISISIVVSLVACSKEESPPPQVVAPQTIAQLEPEHAAPKIEFTEVSQALGINFIFRNGAKGDKWAPETMGGGLAFFDFDNDGDPDLIAVSGTDWESVDSGEGPRTIALYRNDQEEGFTDVSQALGLDFNGYGLSVAIGDYDGDGWQDLFIAALGKNALYHNEQGAGFRNVSHTLGASCSEDFTVSAAFFDADNDGDLDLFVANYLIWSKELDLQGRETLDGKVRRYAGPDHFSGTQPCFYQNLGAGKFRESAEGAGLYVKSHGQPVGKAMGVLPIDVNNDHKMDLLIANDMARNFAFINTGQNHFEERGESLGFAYNNFGKATNGMGIDAAWLSPKQTLTVAIGNFTGEMSSIYRLDEKHFVFSDDAPITGIGPKSRKALTFGVLFVDIDLDGRQDYVQANGHVEPDIAITQRSQRYRQSAQIFWNCGQNCSRSFMLLPEENIGDIHQPLAGRGLAAADFDGDGDIDLAITEIGGRLRLFQNNQNSDNHWLKIDLRQKSDNRFALGAVVEISVMGVVQKQLVMPSRSYLSQNPTTLIFGLGKNDTVDQIKVIWPGGDTQLLNRIAANQRLIIEKVQPSVE